MTARQTRARRGGWNVLPKKATRRPHSNPGFLGWAQDGLRATVWSQNTAAIAARANYAITRFVVESRLMDDAVKHLLTLIYDNSLELYTNDYVIFKGLYVTDLQHITYWPGIWFNHGPADIMGRLIRDIKTKTGTQLVQADDPTKYRALDITRIRVSINIDHVRSLETRVLKSYKEMETQLHNITKMPDLWISGNIAHLVFPEDLIPGRPTEVRYGSLRRCYKQCCEQRDQSLGEVMVTPKSDGFTLDVGAGVGAARP